MARHVFKPTLLGGSDEVVLITLQTKGPQTMEALASVTGLEWEQVFLALDRLSRSGSVSLQYVRPCEYRVSINPAADSTIPSLRSVRFKGRRQSGRVRPTKSKTINP